MYSEKMLLELIENERAYFEDREVGTEEYNESLKRLVMLEEKLADLEKFKKEQKDKTAKNGIDIGKFVLGGLVVPVIGLVCITASEKDITFTGALKEYTRLFIPKKMA